MSSLGPVSYRRRLYLDSFGGSYVCPLDSILGIPPRAKVSTELKTSLVANASEMSYSMAARHSCLVGAVSKSTVCRAIKDCSVSSSAKGIGKPAAKVHLQIDEKYMGFVGSARKKPRYTATIHGGSEPAGGKRRKLAKRTILSASSPSKLAKKVNACLAGSYGMGIGDSIWISGDLAAYIRGFPERVTCCESSYVPDKWHVCRILANAYPELGEIPPSAVGGIVEMIATMGDFTKIEAAGGLDLIRLYESNRDCFAAWADPSYAGCSQEGMNSHYYARRFAKLANRFKPETVEKLCAVIESRENGEDLRLAFGYADPPALEDLPFLGKAYEERERYWIDTSRMGMGLRKAIDSIRRDIIRARGRVRGHTPKKRYR